MVRCCWRFLNFVSVFSIFLSYLPLDKGLVFHLNTLEFVPSLVEIEYVILKTKVNKFQCIFAFFVSISLWEKAWAFIWTQKHSQTCSKGCFVPRFRLIQRNLKKKFGVLILYFVSRDTISVKQGYIIDCIVIIYVHFRVGASLLMITQLIFAKKVCLWIHIKIFYWGF